LIDDNRGVESFLVKRFNQIFKEQKEIIYKQVKNKISDETLAQKITSKVLQAIPKWTEKRKTKVTTELINEIIEDIIKNS
jgi:hypothetical protein